MNRKNIATSEQQQQVPEAKHQNFWQKFGGAPLNSIMRNPKLTPVFLLFLAAAPIAILVLALIVVLRQ